MRIGLLLALLFLVAPLAGQDRSTARSMVVSPYGIVATSYTQASVAGAKILERGGSAVDAAIAANAVLGVTEPMMNGMGGDLFAIYWEAKTGKLYGLNSSGWSPKGLTVEHLKEKGVTAMPQSGIDSVTVPGAVAGWNALHQRFGHLPWSDLFQPAIFYAENGYAVPEMIHTYFESAPRAFANDAEGPANFSAARASACAGRNIPESRCRESLAPGSAKRAGCLLQRRNRKGHSAYFGGAGRHHVSRRSRGIFSRMGRTGFDHLPRMDRL